MAATTLARIAWTAVRVVSRAVFDSLLLACTWRIARLPPSTTSRPRVTAIFCPKTVLRRRRWLVGLALAGCLVRGVWDGLLVVIAHEEKNEVESDPASAARYTAIPQPRATTVHRSPRRNLGDRVEQNREHRQEGPPRQIVDALADVHRLGGPPTRIKACGRLEPSRLLERKGLAPDAVVERPWRRRWLKELPGPIVACPKTPAAAARRVAPSRNADASAPGDGGQLWRAAGCEACGFPIEPCRDGVVGAIALVLLSLRGYSHRPLDARLLDRDRLADRLAVVIGQPCSRSAQHATRSPLPSPSRAQSETRSSTEVGCRWEFSSSARYVERPARAGRDASRTGTCGQSRPSPSWPVVEPLAGKAIPLCVANAVARLEQRLPFRRPIGLTPSSDDEKSFALRPPVPA